MKRVLWVSAHPDPRSLTAGLRDASVEHLREGGVDVVESDLYSMKWNPVLTDDDFDGVEGACSVSDRQGPQVRRRWAERSPGPHRGHRG